MSRLFLTVVDHVSRDFRSPCANMTLGVAALAADFFGVSFLCHEAINCVVSLALSKSGPSRMALVLL